MKKKDGVGMPLDEVLSSIKNMVMGDEPPVLELTDMISKDGSIVKIKKNDGSDSAEDQDMSAFLRMVQENSELSKKNAFTKDDDCRIETSIVASVDDVNDLGTDADGATSTAGEAVPIPEAIKRKTQEDALYEAIKSLIVPLITQWIQENLPRITSRIVEVEVRKVLENALKLSSQRASSAPVDSAPVDGK
jgi:cell pole-organizing protein PopZ